MNIGRTRRFKGNGDYTLLYIGILRENGGDNIIEYQQLKSFIVQVVAISLCKLRIFPLPFSKKKTGILKLLPLQGAGVLQK